MRRGFFCRIPEENRMIFQFTTQRSALHRAVEASIAAHRPFALQHFLSTHGSAAVAQALAQQSSRVVADGLSMLPLPARAAVFKQLPRDARLRQSRKVGLPQSSFTPLITGTRILTGVSP